MPSATINPSTDPPRANRPLVAKLLVLWTITIALILSTVFRAEAQRIYSIGSLNTGDPFINAFEGFRERMAELGYRERQNVRYQYYNSRGNDELLRTIATKLVHDKVDLIVTSSTTATVAAARATQGTPIPVVFLSAGNSQKLFKSFSGSGNNLAGISSASLELTGKRFELLKELAPRTKKIAIPLDPNGVNYKAIVAEVQETAPKFGFGYAEIHVRSVEEMGRVAQSITRKSYDAIYHPPDSLVTEGIEQVVNQAIKEKLPLVTSLLVNVKRGCLATYAADYPALGKQAAALADKIFKGIKPSELPIELPYKLNLALNLQTAKAIDLKIVKEILLRADQVFD
jgi:putative tryptophan/tyrosine transport system substrate-binding protein